MRKQTRFLKHITERTTMHRQKYSPFIVLPDLAVYFEIAAGYALQTGNCAQQSRFAGTGCPV